MPDATIKIRPNTLPSDLDAVRALCWDYRAHLQNLSDTEAGLVATFYPEPKYRALMETLETEHARPQGIILLAELNGQIIGCGMSRAIDPQTSEIKRLFVTAEGRGHGIARRLMTALMDQARDDGYARVVLDTSRNLTAARALYAAMGLQERGPYQDIPAHALPHLIFFEALL